MAVICNWLCRRENWPTGWKNQRRLTHYYCAVCSRCVEISRAKRSANGGPACPCCGVRLRVNPHHKRRRRVLR